MKLTSGKLKFWEWIKPPVGAGTFCPAPILIFYIPPCWKCLPASGAGTFTSSEKGNRLKSSFTLDVFGKSRQWREGRAFQSPHRKKNSWRFTALGGEIQDFVLTHMGNFCAFDFGIPLGGFPVFHSRKLQ